MALDEISRRRCLRRSSIVEISSVRRMGRGVGSGSGAELQVSSAAAASAVRSDWSCVWSPEPDRSAAPRRRRRLSGRARPTSTDSSPPLALPSAGRDEPASALSRAPSKSGSTADRASVPPSDPASSTTGGGCATGTASVPSPSSTGGGCATFSASGSARGGCCAGGAGGSGGGATSSAAAGGPSPR